MTTMTTTRDILARPYRRNRCCYRNAAICTTFPLTLTWLPSSLALSCRASSSSSSSRSSSLRRAGAAWEARSSDTETTEEANRRPPKGRPLLLMEAKAEDRAYVAITLAGRKRSSRIALRDAVARVVDGDSRVVRTRRGVTVVREHDAGADPRVEAEQLRQLVGEAVGDDITAGVGGPKNGAAGAHFALIQSEHAVALGPGLHGHGRTIPFYVARTF